MPTALISLGSNLGDRRDMLDAALSRLRQTSGIHEVISSSYHATQPIGGPAGQGEFLNAAARIETSLSARELFTRMQQVEQELGRTRESHWGPRTIDLDLLLYDQETIDEPDLLVPHRFLAFRRFVLEPAAEVAGDMVHPKFGHIIKLMAEMPRLLTTTREIYSATQQLRAAGKRIGLVPTMGALHEGHLSLVRAAKRECDVAIATIFVNPTQFAPTEDFSKYPRTLGADLALLDSASCDLVFAPASEEIYPPGFSTYVQPPDVAKPLEGTFRPDHFRGVCTVVHKLLNLVPSDAAFFGQKDYQQALVIRHMARDLNVPTAIRVCPIIREPDGLAMSSRNRYLSPEERSQALALSEALSFAEGLYRGGERSGPALAARMQQIVTSRGVTRIDYTTVADADTLADVDRIERAAVALIACHVGTTRLIDNCLLEY